MKHLIELSDVGKSYHLGKQKIPALHDITLNIVKGEFLSIIGPSGSGKSTLLHLLGLMDRPDRGKIIFEGNNTRQFSENELARFRSEKIGFVFQDFNLMDDFTLEENIALPLLIRSGRNSLSGNEQKKVAFLLEKMDLTDRKNHKPRQVSGGQKQRTAIARALIGEPALLLADEPTGNLDQKTGHQIIELLQKICQEDKITMIIVTHDQKIAALADRIIQIDQGQLSTHPHFNQYLG